MALLNTFIPINPTQQDLKAFNCGKHELNDYLKRHAAKNMVLGINRTFVLIDDPGKVAAYYTLAGATVKRKDVPVDETIYPGYPLPIVLIARLAVDQEYQGNGLGAKSLISAMRHSVELSDSGLPAIGIALDVMDEDAMNFYEHVGFLDPFVRDPQRLFMPMVDARKY